MEKTTTVWGMIKEGSKLTFLTIIGFLWDHLLMILALIDYFSGNDRTALALAVVAIYFELVDQRKAELKLVLTKTEEKEKA